MTTPKPGPSGTATPGRHVPLHYLRRVARTILIRSAVQGRVSWHVALPLLAKIEGGAA